MSDSNILRSRSQSSRFSVDGDQAGTGRGLDPYLSFVDHVELLSSQLGNLLKGENNTDVTFVVEGEQFEAHRIILSARCEYFRALLYGGMKETTDMAKIELHDTPAKVFKYLLKYIYSGRLFLRELEERDILDMLILANRYSLLSLESAITGYFKEVIGECTVTDIYDVASTIGITDLESICIDYMDHHADEIINSEGFTRLSRKSLKEIISRGSFCISEDFVFIGVSKWLSDNDDINENETRELLSCIRLPLMEMSYLLNEIRDSKLFSADDILEAVKIKHEKKFNELPHRGYLVKDENLAQYCHDAKVITGEMKETLFDLVKPAYDLEKGYTRHMIKDTGITIELGRPSIINTIKMLLWDLDNRSYSYEIEYSMDQSDWTTLIDYTKHFCRSSQILYFEPIVTRYLKITGTYNSLNKCFHLVSFECLYSNSCLPVQDSFIVPNENVASVMAKAIVLEGVSRNRNALIDGDTKNYDWESGYTCHQIGSGCITIQLAQPFVIGSMRMLLWDCDYRQYCYRIEVSLDQNEWLTVCNRANEPSRSWQTITFPQRPVSFIKLIGTKNTANQVFHVVHFECPAVEDLCSSSSVTESVTDRDTEDC